MTCTNVVYQRRRVFYEIWTMDTWVVGIQSLNRLYIETPLVRDIG